MWTYSQPCILSVSQSLHRNTHFIRIQVCIASPSKKIRIKRVTLVSCCVLSYFLSSGWLCLGHPTIFSNSSPHWSFMLSLRHQEELSQWCPCLVASWGTISCIKQINSCSWSFIAAFLLSHFGRTKSDLYHVNISIVSATITRFCLVLPLHVLGHFCAAPQPSTSSFAGLQNSRN